MEYRFSQKLAELKPSAIREIFKSLTDPEIIAFAAGNPAPESFPQALIAETSAEILRDHAVEALQYGMTEGYPALREAVRRRLHDRFATGREEDSVIIVSGGQQGIELTCKALCDEGDVVLCENPSFIGALNAFRSLGARTVGLTLGEDGIDPEELDRVAAAEPRARLLYLIPTFHNPAGITTSAKRRRAIYEVAKKRGLIIIEDNPYGELRFAGEDIPTIKSIDDAGIVVYCGSFSKILSAGMRVGFLCANAALMSKIIVAKQVEDVHTNLWSQMICTRFMTDFDIEGHLESIRALYRRKCGCMLDALDTYMPKSVRYTRPEGGLFLWCTLPDSMDMPAFVKEALAQKVAVVPGTAFLCDTSAPSQSFRMTYATPSEEQIVRGIRILAGLIRG